MGQCTVAAIFGPGNTYASYGGLTAYGGNGHDAARPDGYRR